MDEQELASQSIAVALGWVTRIQPLADDATGGIDTYVFIQLDEVIAGALPEGEIVLREPGGKVGDRIEYVYGSAQYSVGENVLVFLSQYPDGALHTTAMAMGKYDVEYDSQGAAMAVRSLDGPEVAVLDPVTGKLSTDVAPSSVDLGELIDLVEAAPLDAEAISAGLPVLGPPAALGHPQPGEVESQFTFLGSPSRWFEPDSGIPIAYQVDSTGDAKLGLAAARSAVDDALSAWSNVSGSSIVLADGGLTSPQPFNGCSGGNRVIFNDPYNEITDPTNCGGILAVGGFCTSGDTRVVNGTTFQRIALGKVTFNNGFENCSAWDACNLAEVATHEIGHTIGLGHSSDNDATMRASAHFDGRCAGIRADDVAAIQFIYPAAGTPAPTPTPTFIPVATSTPVRTFTSTATQTSRPTQTPVPSPTSGGGAGQNLAQGKAATQSSTAFGGSADRAVDGVTNGVFDSGFVSHTNFDSQAWWQVDLGSVASISTVDVWNRTDCCSSRLAGFYVLVSDNPFTSANLSATLSQAGVSGYFVAGAAGRPTSVSVNRSGRYVRLQLSGANYLSLAEVQVWGAEAPPAAASPTPKPTSTLPPATAKPTSTQPPVLPTWTPASSPGGDVGANDLALGRPATQSSTAFGAGPERAVDGNTDGSWNGGSLTHTNFDSQGWWQVDLGASQSISMVDLWNRTDCCSSRLSAFYVLVSNTPFASSDLSATLAQSGVSAHYVAGTAGRPTSVSVGRTGRYVRIQLSGANYLSLAEVQIWPGGSPSVPTATATPRMTPTATPASVSVDLAVGKLATESSTAYGGVGARAVDGITDGDFSDGSVTHTGFNAQAWWQVDLGAVSQIDSVDLWNRTDCCSTRLSAFYLFVSDVPFAGTDVNATATQAGVSSYYFSSAGNPRMTIAVNRTGRYVRVQLTGTGYLSLAEAQVWGPATSSTVTSPPPSGGRWPFDLGAALRQLFLGS